MCISTGNFDSIFFLGFMPFLNFEIWRKWKILLDQKQLVSTTPLKPLNRIASNFLVMKDIMCIYAFLQEMLIWSFWGAIYIPFLSDWQSLMLGIAIHCIQHSQAMLERGVCELAHSFFHFFCVDSSVIFQPLLIPADLVKEEDTKRVIDTTVQHYGKLNILVSFLCLTVI